ncbi:YqcC family protein [Rahnella sp. WP5]|uniref:YqcC family protein n=1 Tax=Rahnella sp. WP5 TaxID=1500266 RepID=UPI00056518D7|nr:YqcC family protein [Rahnella sp. WP5]
MNIENQVRQILEDIEQVMRDEKLWHATPPEAEAFESKEPFSVDTLSAEQWLQWVLVPRMYALLEAQTPMPTRFAITPYFEVAMPEALRLLTQLQRLDDLLNIED